MEIRVLGPLDVRTDAGDSRLPRGRKQRLLLSSLVVAAPRVVSAERLVELLWDDELPDDATAALRTQISRLRTFLRQAGAPPELLQSEPHGYRMAVAPDDVDTGRFEVLLARARDALAPEIGLAILDEALALFRGRAFEEFCALPQFMGEVARLEELRAGACERRVECLLALQRTSDAVAAAEVLTHGDRLRERPRALYMEALYRAGRQHEALSTFQQFRRLLSEELGLEPSPALTKLQVEILKHERSAAFVAARTPAVPDARARIPLPLTGLIGRKDERASVLRLVRSMRLLTLTGVGGSGKTRLALEISHELAQNGEVVWVALDAVSDPAFVAQEVASALGICEHPGRSPAQALSDVLANRTVLLVLDNCEHVIEACAVLAMAVLQRCPGVTILATSREPLGVAGEAAWPVPPLRVPLDTTDASSIAECEAVQLFVERARAALPSFELSAHNAGAIAKVCSQLDGMPLCLELAAALVRVLTLDEIFVRLQAGLDLLSRGSRTALPRHQTIRAAMDWSYELLSEDERRLLERLSVFASGFTLDAAEAVCGESGVLAQGAVLSLLSALVEKSLVVMQHDASAARYRLLEIVRAYARERLALRGDESRTIARHAELFADFAEEAEPLLLASDRIATTRRLASEQENLRAALTSSLASPTGAVFAYRLVGALFWFWHSVGQCAEARRWAEAALALPADGLSDTLRARARFTAAMACWLVGDAVGARAHAEESLRLARVVSEPLLLVRALSACMWSVRDLREHERATTLAAECVAVARRHALPDADLGFALWIRSAALYTAGDLKASRAAGTEAEALWRATGVHWGLSRVLHLLSLVEHELGAVEEAARLCREAIAVLGSDGEAHFVARSIEGLALALVRGGAGADAARLLGAATAIRERIGMPLLPFEVARHERTVEAVESCLEDAAHARLWAEGRAMGLPQVIALATASAG